MKQCGKCKILKESSEFSRNKRRRDGLAYECKICASIRDKNNYRQNLEKRKEYDKQRRLNNPEKWKEISKAWRVKNPERQKELRKRWQINHPEKIKEYNKKRLSVPKGKLSSNISRAIRFSIKKNSKANRHWEMLVDFTIDQLKKHLEKRFKPGMTWENYGSVWEIDHKIPIAVFNFEKPEDIDFRLCWSLKNLQPLDVSENARKKDKITKPFQPSLLMRGIR